MNGTGRRVQFVFHINKRFVTTNMGGAVDRGHSSMHHQRSGLTVDDFEDVRKVE